MNLRMITPPPRGRGRRVESTPTSRVVLIGGVVVIAAGLAAGYFTGGPRGPAPEVRSSSGFDVPYVAGGPASAAAPGSAPAAPAPAGAPSSPPPIAAPGLYRPEAARPPAAASPAAAPAAANPPPKDSRFTALLASPAQFLLDKTFLGSPRALQRFLADPKRVGGWLGHPLVRETLDSPAAVRLLLKPPVVRAFIATPAMSDKQTVSALARSSLVSGLARSRGVVEGLKDQAVVNAVMADPQVLQWVARNPDVGRALPQFGPALAGATGRSR